MSRFEDAIVFAAEKHRGAVRKIDHVPYILHPMEVALIASRITQDDEVLAAAVLHDTVEDAGVLPDELRERFGERVAALVASETEDKRADIPKRESWRIRKEESLEKLKNSSDPGVKVLWLSDKLSNIRGLYKAKERFGDAMWGFFNQKDPAQHEWYYKSAAGCLSELRGTEAYREFAFLISAVFGKEQDDPE